MSNDWQHQNEPSVKAEAKAVLEVDGIGVPNRRIDFYYKESHESEFEFAGTSMTDSNGAALFTIPLQVSGMYDFEARHNGDLFYASSNNAIRFDPFAEKIRKMKEELERITEQAERGERRTDEVVESNRFLATLADELLNERYFRINQP